MLGRLGSDLPAAPSTGKTIPFRPSPSAGMDTPPFPPIPRVPHAGLYGRRPNRLQRRTSPPSQGSQRTRGKGSYYPPPRKRYDRRPHTASLVVHNAQNRRCCPPSTDRRGPPRRRWTRRPTVFGHRRSLIHPPIPGFMWEWPPPTHSRAGPRAAGENECRKLWIPRHP